MFKLGCRPSFSLAIGKNKSLGLWYTVLFYKKVYLTYFLVIEVMFSVLKIKMAEKTAFLLFKPTP